MKKREPISHIMTSDLVTVSLSNTLREAKALFDQQKVRHLPVVSGEKLIGILSLTDMMRVGFGSLGEGANGEDSALHCILDIEGVMKKNPRCLAPEDTIRQAAEILTEEEYHALPVVDGDKLVGIVTTTDLIRYLVQQY